MRLRVEMQHPELAAIGFTYKRGRIHLWSSLTVSSLLLRKGYSIHDNPPPPFVLPIYPLWPISGAGRLVIAASLPFPSLTSCTGIEILPSLHDYASFTLSSNSNPFMSLICGTGVAGVANSRRGRWWASQQLWLVSKYNHLHLCSCNDLRVWFLF